MSQEIVRRTQVEITEDEQDAMEFLKNVLGLTTDASVRRFAILQLARAKGWLPREEKPKTK